MYVEALCAFLGAVARASRFRQDHAISCSAWTARSNGSRGNTSTGKDLIATIVNCWAKSVYFGTIIGLGKLPVMNRME
jgi:hypothetical protein